MVIVYPIQLRCSIVRLYFSFFFFFVKLLTRLVCAFNEGRTKYNTVQEVEEINQKSFQLNL